MDISVTVVFFIILCVCTVTDFSAEDLRQILHGGSSASKAGNLPFCGTLLPPEAQNRTSRNQACWPMLTNVSLVRAPFYL